MNRILIIDDDEDLREIVKDVLTDEGFAVSEAADGATAIAAFRTTPPGAVLLDLNMPGMHGMEVIEKLRELDRKVPVIVLTAYGDIPTAVRAIKMGAYDFTTKPPDFDRLLVTLRRAVERHRLENQMEEINTALSQAYENLFGRSASMKAVIGQIEQVAKTDFSVIIQGETGTGKSVVARAIHDMSRRSGKSFTSVDIGLIPDNLVESELFGYRRGAFTGADKDKTGYLEAADGGTIFLDELENMSSHVQSKLLSFIERKLVYPLGGTFPVSVDVRITSATNSDIRQSVIRKEFRTDLFYRLGEFFIQLPPLRERAEDIPFFARRFLLDVCAELRKQIRGIGDDAFALLHRHPWPGNLRELKNVIRRAALVCNGDVITAEHVSFLGLEHGAPGPGAGYQSLKEEIKALEKTRIREALTKTGGNKTRAAEMLKMSYKNLCEKIKEYSLNMAD